MLIIVRKAGIMTDREKKELKSAIEEKKTELIKTISDLKEETKPLGLDSAIGRISRMDYINNKSVNEASLRKAETDLKSIDRWLSLYDSEKFGKCSYCGKEINPKRLIYMPASTRCINCANK